jgi:glycosyltransferase involved in cell wall biosynthesis
VSAAPRRVLVVATKSPWQAAGGGRIEVRHLIAALRCSGADVALVAPDETAIPCPSTDITWRPARVGARSWLSVALAALTGRSAVVERYRSAALADTVRSTVSSFAPDVVVIVQAQLGWLIPELRSHAAVILREENVEADLLFGLAAVRPWMTGWLYRLEARRLARAEACVCHAADAVAAISADDADRLRQLAPRAEVLVVPPGHSTLARAISGTLEGDPSFLAVGSFDWGPNRDGIRWLLNEIWPLILARRPGSMLHIAGPGSAKLPPAPRVQRLGVVADAADLYDPSTTVLVPVRVGSGVRVRLLEAWAAGVPALTTSVGAGGLGVGEEPALLTADTIERFADEAVRLATDSRLRAAIVAAGRARLANHAVERVALAAVEVLDLAQARAGSRLS